MAYVFDPVELHRLVKQVTGQPIATLVPELLRKLADRYPGQVHPTGEWVFNNAGGAMGMMTVLHASLTEYLIVFGSPIGTEGHTGRFFAEDFFFILEGEQWAYDEGDLERKVYRPGEVHYLPRGVARGYRFPDRCFALEYARGWIPLMLPFGFADGLFSTLDLPTLGKTVRLYTQSVLRAFRGSLGR